MKLSIPSCLALVVLVSHKARATDDTPTICMHTPAITAFAGSMVAAKVHHNPQGKPCQAILRFADANFLPVIFEFNSLRCLGDTQLLQFAVPTAVPNGDAYINWKCAGQTSPTCQHAWITGGDTDLNSLMREQVGQVACLVPSTSTATALSVSTSVGTTLTERILFTTLLTQTSLLTQNGNLSVQSTRSLAPTTPSTTTTNLPINTGSDSSATFSTSRPTVTGPTEMTGRSLANLTTQPTGVTPVRNVDIREGTLTITTTISPPCATTN